MSDAQTQTPHAPQASPAATREELPNDSSLTLGQLKKIVKQLPSKQKQPQHDFIYADSDTLKNEIDEFYNYLEIPQYIENKELFQEGFGERWTECTISERRVYIEYLLEQLELKDIEKRLATTRRLLYIAQGTFAECSDSTVHLHWIVENNKILRKSGALLSYYQALKLASNAHDICNQIDPQVSQLADINREIDYYLTLLYMLVEVHRGDEKTGGEKFGNELSRLDPPLTVFLFGLVAQLREKNVKTFPVKKLLLLLWKVMISSLGGFKDFARLKNSARVINGLPLLTEEGLKTKTTPQDLYTFQMEITQKYPTYTPPTLPLSITNPAIIKPTAVPIQSQPRTESPGGGSSSSGGGSSSSGGGILQPAEWLQAAAIDCLPEFKSGAFHLSLLGRWARRSQEHTGGGRTVRGEYVRRFGKLAEWGWVGKEWGSGSGGGGRRGDDGGGVRGRRKNGGRNGGRGGCQEVRESGSRLRLDILDLPDSHFFFLKQHAILPNVQNIIIVLLKLLLATVTTNATNSNAAGTGATAATKANGTGATTIPATSGQTDSTSGENDAAANTQPALPSTLPSASPSKENVEEMDNLRNREISSKAISAILLLLLKYCKVTRIL
ncbi:N1221-like protein-domain-containing protein [Endogone sp. FLAS-F59071]|nr:N1221-like protein-domain-containing protein [Endogone sp. FLAS-F59071]|eukprot:RUS21017.1 N1221-like protein-domain-containing protein [Endogone sp. FLAS-F59071]